MAVTTRNFDFATQSKSEDYNSDFQLKMDKNSEPHLSRSKSQLKPKLVPPSSESETGESKTVVRKQRSLPLIPSVVPPPKTPAKSTAVEGSDVSEASFEEVRGGSMCMKITLLEKLIRSHPIWYLPSLSRSKAVQFLENRETGNFIVRNSTQAMTMAISVKLTLRIEHYLLKAASNDSGISLEKSKNTFETVHQLIAHYCVTSDEIPVRLALPSTILEATSRQQLTDIGRLGPEFWNIKPPTVENKLKSNNEDKGEASVLEDNFSAITRTFSTFNNKTFRNTKNINLLKLTPDAKELDSDAISDLISEPISKPPPPPRWSTSSLLSYASQPTNNAVALKRSSLHSNPNPANFFQGKRTLYADRASDYEDIWSPTIINSNKENEGNVNTATKSTIGPRFSSSKSIYSEPFDAIAALKTKVSHRNSDPNIYWRSTATDRNLGRQSSSFDSIVEDSKSKVKNDAIPHWMEYLNPETGLNVLHGIKFPVFLPPNLPNRNLNAHRFSRYDNLEFSKSKSADDFFLENVISKPWDSSKWEYLLKSVSDQLDLVRLQNQNMTSSWQTVQFLVKELAADSKGIFGPTLKSFMTCTISSKCKDPSKILGNTRQFMNGMKNYLTGGTSAETEGLRREIQSKIDLLEENENENIHEIDEFCELDLALEEVLTELVLKPLYHFFLRLLNEANSDCALSTSGSVRSKKREPIHFTFNEFEEACSPLVKLQKLRELVSKVRIQGRAHSSSNTSVEILAAALLSLDVDNIKSHIDYTIALLPPSVHQVDSFILELLQSAAEYLRENPLASFSEL